jgi:glycosyltransferase involved in cell wall biosynthesis
VRIALVASNYLPHAGTSERRVARLADGLANRGVEVEVLTQGRPRGLPAVSDRGGVIVRRFAASIGRPPAAPGLWHYIRRAARSFDVADAHSAHLSLGLGLARAGVRCLVLTPFGPLQHLVRWPYVTATSALVRHAAQVVCHSHAQAAILSRGSSAAAERIRVVPNGVDLELIQAAEPFARRNWTILTVGRLERYQRIDRAIAAMAGMEESSHLVVVGGGPLRRSLQARAADLLVSSRVEFVGSVPDTELYRWLRTSRVLVTLADEETSGFQLLETLAAGVPAVASDIPAHREAAAYADGRGVRFVPTAGSPLEVADAIVEAARSTVPSPDRMHLPIWDAVVDETLALYEAALLRRPRPTGPRVGRERGKAQLICNGRHPRGGTPG